ncbi:SemiSWEET transporter [Oculatella sp. LEGE 06141]|uniref:SemiSWEET family sugar transporter n=1 Tax=Oculatella sp. LEGE 06141 TaxID=1828648 RepID=UPI001880D9E4|nr:SemiSWEET transporter [Oculatella sp. LEGE 06141]MBE9180374.1 SemiSWEET transporter [Oculatella sp. LEGE 06141]
MNFVTILGLAAASFTTFSFLPQVLKTWQTKSAGDLSLSTFSIFCVGVFLWLVYGVLIADLPVILANAVTFILSLTVIGQALIYRKPRPKL